MDRVAAATDLGSCTIGACSSARLTAPASPVVTLAIAGRIAARAATSGPRAILEVRYTDGRPLPLAANAEITVSVRERAGARHVRAPKHSDHRPHTPPREHQAQRVRAHARATPAESKVATSFSSRAALATRGKASSAPVPSPNRRPR